MFLSTIFLSKIPLEQMGPIWQFLLIHVEPAIWYLSDFFYWLLYFSAFVLKLSKPLPNNNSKTTSSSRCSTIQSFINDFNLTINSLYVFTIEYVRIKLGMKCLDFSPLFRLVMIISLFGAVLKAWNNFYIILDVSSDMLSILVK